MLLLCFILAVSVGLTEGSIATTTGGVVGLRDVRQRKVFSMRQLAERAGVSPATIVKIEKGEVRPYPSTLRKLAAALGVEPEELADHAHQER